MMLKWLCCELLEKNEDTHGSQTYVNSFQLAFCPKLHVYPCGTFSIDIDKKVVINMAWDWDLHAKKKGATVGS